jgi:hypothetical protein
LMNSDVDVQVRGSNGLNGHIKRLRQAPEKE